MSGADGPIIHSPNHSRQLGEFNASPSMLKPCLCLLMQRRVAQGWCQFEAGSVKRASLAIGFLSYEHQRKCLVPRIFEAVSGPQRNLLNARGDENMKAVNRVLLAACAVLLGACPDETFEGDTPDATPEVALQETTPSGPGLSRPLLTQVVPPEGPATGGTVVAIKGAGFARDAKVFFGDVPAPAVVYIDPSTLTAIAPAGLAGPADVSVVNLDGADGTFQSGFVYYDLTPESGPSPSTLRVRPNTGPAGGGTALIIEGSGFKSGALVYLDWKSVTPLRIEDSYITLVTPSVSVGTVDVAVTNPDGQSDILAKAFAAYDEPKIGPNIETIRPIAGPVEGGTTVTLEGTLFAADSILIFDGRPTDFTFESPERITFVTPAGQPGNAFVSVTNVNGKSTIWPEGFLYYFEPPNVHTVSPRRGGLGGGTVISISGDHFDEGARVWLGSNECVTTAVVDDATITCTAPAALEPGPVDVLVEAGSGLAGVLPGGFEYGDYPLITEVVPAVGPSDGGIIVLVLGEGFSENSEIRFGDNVATTAYFTGEDGIGVVLPAGQIGSVDVSVSDGGTVTDTLVAGFTYEPVVVVGGATPTLTQVLPATGPTTGGGITLLRGFNLPTNAQVSFGTTPAVSVQTISNTELSVRLPAVTDAGPVDVVVTNVDTGAQTVLVGGYTYYAPEDAVNPAPTLNWVKPTTGPTSGNTLAMVDGTGMLEGALIFVGGAPATSLKTVSDTVNSFRTPARGAGPADVVFVNPDGQYAELVGGFVYAENPGGEVTLQSVAPVQGSVSGGTSVTLIGAGFAAGLQLFVDGIPVASTVSSSTTLQFDTPAHAPGLVDIAVTPATGMTSTLVDAFNYVQLPPIIAGVTPNNGPPAGGTQILVSGQGFHPAATLTIAGVEASIITVTDTLISAITPAGSLGPADVMVVNPDQLSHTFVGGFTYADEGGVIEVTIAAISPNTGDLAGGTTATITGSGFGPGASVLFGSALAPSVTVLGNATLVVEVPPGQIGPVDVQVVVPSVGSATVPNGFFYFDPLGGWPAPNLKGIYPTAGPTSGGTIARIDVRPAPAGSKVFVDGMEATVLGADETEHLVVEMPPHEAGAVSISVMFPDGHAATLAAAFTYYVPGPGVTAPTLTQINPTGGSTLGGDAVDLTGTGFSTGTIAFMGYRPVADMLVVDATSLSGTSPANTAGLADVSVTRADGFSATLSASFAYSAPAPTPSAVFPSQSPLAGGITAVLSGAGFQPGAEVFVGGVEASDVVVPLDSVLTFTVPPSATEQLADIQVINPDTQTGTLAAAFSYVDTSLADPAPQVLALTPPRGPVQGGTVLAIFGNDFKPGCKALFGGVEAQIHVVDPGLVTVTTPSGFVGPVDVTVLNPDGQSGVLAAGFDYLIATAPAPILAGITPDAGPEEGGTPVILTGDSFTGGGVGFVGYRPLSSWAVLNSSIATGTTLPVPAGTVDVVVTNGDGQSAILGGAFEFIGAPKIDSFDPPIGPIAGGTLVTLAGANYVTGARVFFGGIESSSVTVLGALVINAITPPAVAAGPVQVTVRNPDGQTFTATTPFTYAEAPIVADVFPSQGSADGDTPVIIRGSSFLAGASVTFGTGQATSINLVDESVLTARTPAGTIDETVDVQLTNVDAQSGISYGAFTFVDPASIGPAPTVSAVKPGTGPTTGGTWGLVEGANFQEGAQVVVGLGVCPDVEVLAASRLRFVTPPTDTEGAVDVIVINPDGGFVVVTDGFTYTDPATLDDPPSLASVTPDLGPTAGGSQVQLIGTELDLETLVFFDTSPALAITDAPPGIEVTTPGHDAALVAIVITDSEGQTVSFADSYEYVPPPSITGVVASQGPSAGGTYVEISGENFIAGPTPTLSSSVLFCEEYISNLNCVPVPDAVVTVVNDGLIAITTPPQFPGLNDVVVVNPDGQIGVAEQAFFFTPPPNVSGVTPPSGSTLGGDSVTITGTGFQANATVTISGAACTDVVVVAADTITCTTPPNAAGAAAVVVANPDLSTDTLGGGFTYVLPPRITAVFPSLGPESGGTITTIQGSGFVAGSLVTVGGTSATVTSASAGAIQIVTPAGVGPSAVRVDNPDAQFDVAAGGFLYVPDVQAPSIVSVNPTFGLTGGGYQVSIIGNHFLQGVNLSFGNDSIGWVDCLNIVVKNAGTLITCKAPAHPAALLDVRVQNSDGQQDQLADGFEFVAPASLPGLAYAGIVPARGPATGGYEATVYGQGFLTGVNVYFGDSATSTWTIADNVIRLGPTLLKVTVPMSATNGPVDIRVSNPPVAGPDDVIAPEAFVYGQGAIIEPKGHRLPVDGSDYDTTPVIFDANGDGQNDVFVIRSNGSRDDLYINTVGDDGEQGWFVDQTAENMPASGYSSRSNPLVSDFDGDGDIDIVFRYQTYYIGIYRNAGDGTFTSESMGYFNQLNTTTQMVLGDLDCDGTPDIFVSRLNNANIVLVGDGTGDFTQRTDIVPTLSEPSRAVALSDVDNDGDLDVLIANDNAVQNRLHYNNCNNIGDPTEWSFIDASYGTGANFPVSGFNTRGVTFADINADGWDDAVLVNFGQSTRIYFNNGGNFLNDDGLHFPQTEDNTSALQVFASDVDQDNDVDLVVFKQKTTASGGKSWPYVYLNDFTQGGSGSYTDASPVNLPEWTGHDMDYMAVGDLNMDGLDDLYLVGHAHQDWMLWNNGYAENAPEIPSNQAGFGVFVNNTFKDYPEDVWQTETCAVADIDGDLDLDIFMNNAWNESPRLWVNDGAGNFFDDVGARIPDIDCNWGSANFMDLNNDGDLDLVIGCDYINPGGGNPAGHGGIRQLVNDGTGFFTNVTSTNAPASSTSHEYLASAVGDLDDDGLDDWIGGSRFHWRTMINGGDPFGVDGAYFFNSPSLMNVSSNPDIREILIDDLNDDGYVDVYVGLSSGQNQLWHNNGFGEMTNVSSTHLPSVSDNTYDTVSVDVDNDGDVDIFVANNGTNKLHVGELDFKYADASASNLPNLGSQSSRAVVTADFDRDGLPDFFVVNYFLKNHLLLNVGGANFQDFSTNLPTDKDRNRCACTGDFDGDGSMDLFTCGDGANRIYLNKTPLP